jgi:hypothetical protein
VKFLAINTSFEAIKKLTTKVCALEGEASKTKKKLNASKKASSSAANNSCLSGLQSWSEELAAPSSRGFCLCVELKHIKSLIHPH